MLLNVLYFENQEVWILEEIRRTWRFLYVYLTTTSGMQQGASALKQEKGVPRFMSLKMHFRNFALSKVKISS